MSAPHRPVDPRPSLPAMEEAVLERWRKRDVFRASVARREGAPPFVFYEGPPTANGPPGAHHVLSRAFKDIFPRYKTMRGYSVERKGGWDCHGLPVEIEVEKQLGITSKEDIERYGIAEFNARCRESVFTFLEEWDRLTERIGFWIDLGDAYRTLDGDYIESVWWALRQIWDKDLLYEGHKVVPYCPRCGTALSSHEVALGYRDVIDPSVYVRLPVVHGAGPIADDDVLLIWTTTPWTLVSNAAVAVDPDLTYVRVDPRGDHDRVVIVAEALVDRVVGEGARILDRFPGSVMEGTTYEAPFDYIAAEAYGDRGHTVLLGDFVTDEGGTGLVHTAVAFGEDDYRLGAQYGLTVVNPVKLDGTYDERIGEYAGRFVKDADADLVDALRASGRLWRAEDYEHAYPHCWRCGTPLLYYAKPSWYIATTKIRDELLAANETINWHPEHIKHGRFGKWLESNVDWALSRERYWGTPLPLWRSEEGEVMCLGSFAELEALSGVAVTDPHRPYVDDITFAHPESGNEMRRVPEVIDVWFDSGAMPFAQHHAPFEYQELFERRFPADFICEALDQTRGWFYSLLAVSTLVQGRASYENVVCLGLILDEAGQKMSKSKGNVVAPWEVIDRHGADAFRWYYFTSKQPWDGYRFSVDAVGEGVRQFLLQLWNTYAFYVLYANAGGVVPGPVAAEPADDLDRWIISRLHATTEQVADRLDAYDATFAGRAIAEFVDDLSNWYVRRSRRRFWEGDPAAFATLRHCLVTITQLLAPFCPFITDEIYDNLDGSEPSVHLCDFPAVGGRDEALEVEMAIARETVRLGLKARGQAKVKVRQPLGEAVIVAVDGEREAIERMADVVREELNVKALRFVSAADELGSLEVKPNYRALGPRFGSQMPQVAAAVAALDPTDVGATLRDGRQVGIAIDGRDHTIGSDDLLLSMQPLHGYEVEREGSHAVALDLTLDAELRREGQAREIVHAVQSARRNAGLAVEDRITLALGGDAGLLDAARAHEAYVTGETLATSVAYGGGADGAGGSVGSGEETATIDGAKLQIAIVRAPGD